MRKRRIWRILLAVAVAFTAYICAVLLVAQEPRALDKMSYWLVQRRGANYGPSRLRQDELQAAADFGIEFLRLRVESLRPAQRDFLLGNADDYRGIDAADLRQLRAIFLEVTRRISLIYEVGARTTTAGVLDCCHAAEFLEHHFRPPSPRSRRSGGARTGR